MYNLKNSLNAVQSIRRKLGLLFYNKLNQWSEMNNNLLGGNNVIIRHQ